MSVTEQLLAGLELTVTGMVTVFVVLAFMVFAIRAMSRFANYLAPPQEPHPPAAGGSSGGAPDATVISAITAAVHRFRRDRR